MKKTQLRQMETNKSSEVSNECDLQDVDFTKVDHQWDSYDTGPRMANEVFLLDRFPDVRIYDIYSISADFSACGDHSSKRLTKIWKDIIIYSYFLRAYCEELETIASDIRRVIRGKQEYLEVARKLEDALVGNIGTYPK